MSKSLMSGGGLVGDYGSPKAVKFVASGFVVVMLIAFLGWNGRMHSEGLLRKTAFASIHETSQTGYQGTSIQEPMFGGGPFQNKTGSPITVLDVKPTNIPDGLQIVTIGLISSAGIGAVDYMDFLQGKIETTHTDTVLTGRVQIPANSSRYFQPVVVCKATKSGTFVIQGLLITYQWRGHTYRDYFPDQFCVSTLENAPDPDPPPTQWW